MNTRSKNLQRMSEADLCKKSQVAECLFDGYNDGFSPYDMEKAEVLKFYKTTAINDPCSGEEIDNDDIILSLCAYNHVNMEALEAELGKAHHIEIDPSIDKKCPNFNCVYNYLNNSGNKLFCDKLFNKFYYREGVTIKFSSFTQPGGPAGKTSYSEDGSVINIEMNGIYCDNPLEIAATMIHEGIHASLYNKAKNKDQSLTRKEIIAILRLNDETNDVSHEVMAKKYVKLLAQSLRAADNNRYPVDYYMYLAWIGIQNAGYRLGILEDGYISQYVDKHNILMSSTKTFCP